MTSYVSNMELTETEQIGASSCGLGARGGVAYCSGSLTTHLCCMRFHTHTNICTPTARTRAAYGHKDRLWYDGVLSCWFKVCVRAWCKVTVYSRQGVGSSYLGVHHRQQARQNDLHSLTMSSVGWLLLW